MARIATKQTEVFKFDELSEAAQRQAHAEWAEGGPGGDWWDDVYNAAHDELADEGINVEKFYFSGFSGPGDGACFAGTLDMAKFMQVHGLDVIYPAAFQEALERRALCRIEHRGPLYNEVSVRFSYPWQTLRELEQQIERICRGRMKKLYTRLKGAYVHELSVGNFKEIAARRAWEFTAEGSIYS